MHMDFILRRFGFGSSREGSSCAGCESKEPLLTAVSIPRRARELMPTATISTND
jgi:hypothetical protein